MNTNVNVEGIEPHEELIKALINFKQGKILENNFYTTKVSYTREMMMGFDKDGMSQEVVVEKIKSNIIQQVSKEIYSKLLPQIEKTEDKLNGFVEYSLQFLLIQPHELKHIIDYCVRTMPQQAIDEIRK